MTTLIIYMKKGCPYCKKVKSELKNTNIDYKLYYLDKDFTRQQFKRKYGEDATFPRAYIKTSKSIRRLKGGSEEILEYIRKK